MVKEIPLTQGKVALVDAEDYDRLMQWKWHCTANGYAARTICIGCGAKNRKAKKIWMHRLLNQTPDTFDTDHVNGDKLDNRKVNLRNATRAQNKWNTPAHKDNPIGLKGIHWYKKSKKWMATITLHGRQRNLGYYSVLDDAVDARNAAVSKLHPLYGQETVQ